MAPEHLRFGGGAADSVISPFVAVWLLIAIVLIIVLPRRKAIMPFLIAFFTIPIGEVLVVGGIHLTALRILILAVLARRLTFSRRDKYPGGVNGVDWVVILWSVSAVVAFFLQFPGTACSDPGTWGPSGHTGRVPRSPVFDPRWRGGAVRRSRPWRLSAPFLASA